MTSTAQPDGQDGSPLDAVLACIDARTPETLDDLVTLLRIPSISAEADRRADCLQAAQWIADALAEIGFDTWIDTTHGAPVLTASHPGPGDGSGPQVMFYGHYDVQPAADGPDWDGPPFEPAIIDGPSGHRIRARGASDNKGQVLSWLAALRAFVEVNGLPPVPVSVLVEGEEEIGSPSLAAVLADWGSRTRPDVVLAIDASQWDRDTPAIVTNLRGMLYVQLDVEAATCDLHSGLYGGVAVNPLDVVAGIVAGLHDADRRVTLAGFYDGVTPVRAAERVRLAALGFDTARFLDAVGLTVARGEAGHGDLERLWLRPTAEVNGLWGGYSGPGAKTVIPASAHAKLSFRLVEGQDPDAVLDMFRSHVAAHLPPGARSAVQVLSATPAASCAHDSAGLRLAAAALAAEFGRPPVLTGSGGTLPVFGALRRQFGAEVLLYGWALEEDNAHGPNESFDLAGLERGARVHARLLWGLQGRTDLRGTADGK